MKQIDVMVLSDSTLLRDAIQAMLLPFPGFTVIGKCETEDAVRMAARLHPDVLLLDISLPDSESRNILQALQADMPDLRVIAVTYYDDSDPEEIIDVLGRGIRGYLCGKEQAAEVADAIRAVAAGDVYLCPGASDVLLKSYRRHARTSRQDPPAGGSPLGAQPADRRCMQLHCY